MRTIFVSSVLAMLACTTGCKSAQELSTECIQGSQSSCEGACDKGISGIGGCMSAAQAYAQSDRATAGAFYVKACEGGEARGCVEAANNVASSGDGPSEIQKQWLERATELFGKACEAGNKEACLEAAGRLTGDDPPATTQRNALVAKACELGDQTSCEQTVRSLLGIDAAGVERAAARFCKATKHTDDDVRSCTSALTGKARELGDASKRCDAADASGCQDIGDGLAVLDAARAATAYERVCKLRKLDADVLWTGWTVELNDARGTPIRIVTDKDGGQACCTASLFDTRKLRRTRDLLESVDPDMWNPIPGGFGAHTRSAPEPNPQLDRGAIEISFGTRAERELAAMLDTAHGAWMDCYRAALKINPNLQGTVKLQMLLDANGRVLPIGIRGSTVPDGGFNYCMGRALVALKSKEGPACRAAVTIEVRPQPSS